MKHYHARGSARRRKFRLPALLLFVSVVFTVVAMALSGSSRKIKIMPLGDSITGSFANMASYRFWLWQQLVSAGYADKIEFVGTRCGTGDQDAGDGCGTPLYPCSVWSCKHNGIHDKTTGDILQRVPGFIRQDTADIVLLHVGTNDVTYGQTRMNTAQSNIGAIIDSMRAVNPNVTVLLCKIIPANEGQSMTDSLLRLNALIGQLAADKNTQCSPVILVDQYTGFTFGDLQPDGVHPLVSGEKKIAGKFFAALLPVLHSIDAISSCLLFPVREARISNGATASFSVRANAYPCVRDVAIIWNGSVIGHGVRQSDSLFSYNYVAPRVGFFPLKAVVSDYCGHTDTSNAVLLGVALSDNALQLTIPQIQGPSQISPNGSSLVKTSGVVTAVCKDSSGFWMQDTLGDGDPRTSDAIFVSQSGATALPSRGDFVSVSGIVQDYQPSFIDMTTTRLSCVDSITVISMGNPMPLAPVINGITNGAGDIPTVGKSFYAYEGMLVKFDRTAIVSPSSQPAFSPLGNLKNAQGFYMSTRVANVFSPALDSVNYNPAVMLLGSKTMDLSQVRAQDTLFSLTGVVDYDKGLLYIQPIPDYTAVSHSSTPASPVSKRTWIAGTFRISTLDLGGFFDTIDTWGKNDPVMTRAAYATKLAKTKKAIVQELLMPAVLCVQNVENTHVLADIASSVNSLGGKYKSATGRKYLGFSIDTPSSPDPRGLINGFLYDTTQIALDSAVLMGGAAVESAFGIYSSMPAAQPVIGMFKVSGAAWAIVNITLIDKSRDAGYFCTTLPFSQNSKLVRNKQAAAVRKWINATLAAAPSLYMIIAGEFNDYPFAEPFDGSDYPVATIAGNAGKGETVFINAYDRLPADARYTCTANGRAHMTEQLMATPSLAPKAKGIDVLHFNANYEDSFMSDSTTAIRCSSHDPIEIRF